MINKLPSVLVILSRWNCVIRITMSLIIFLLCNKLIFNFCEIHLYSQEISIYYLNGIDDKMKEINDKFYMDN